MSSMLSLQQVADRLNVSRAMVRQMCVSGRLVAVDLGSQRRRYWRVPEESLQEFIRAKSNSSPTPPRRKPLKVYRGENLLGI